MLAVPFSLIGAVWYLWLLGYHMSIAVWVGMIALMGLDAETGVFMLLFLDLSYNDAVRKGKMRNYEDLREAIIHGAVKRVRPKAMTVMAAMMGLLPIMWSMGTGADVMKRIAAPMIAGLVTSFLMELLVYPVIYALWKGSTGLHPTSPLRLQLRKILLGILLDRVSQAGQHRNTVCPLTVILIGLPCSPSGSSLTGQTFCFSASSPIRGRKLGKPFGNIRLLGGVGMLFVGLAVDSRRRGRFLLVIFWGSRAATARPHRHATQDDQTKHRLVQTCFGAHVCLLPRKGYLRSEPPRGPIASNRIVCADGASQ